MSDLSVTERRLAPIRDLIKSRNWKQALQQCDKWQKKGEKSDRFLALKASILVNQPDKSQLEKGKAETLQLCHRNPPVTDITALYQLQDSLKYLSLQNEEGPKLWERAIAARPNDKDLLTTLLNGSISDGNWMSAQKATMALRKAFPKERQYDFWNLLLCYLIHKDHTLPQKDRDLFGRLAYMLTSKAAEAVPAKKDELLTSGKEISTPEELSLLVKIYTETGHANEAVKALQGDKLGLESRLGELDPQFAFSLYLEALDALGDEQEVFNACKSLIVSGSSVSKQHAEDDRVWKILRRGSKSKEIAKSCLELAQSIYQSDSKCRAAYLAYFDVVTSTLNSAGDVNQEDLVLVCEAYYETFSSKPFCFNDLIQPLQKSPAALKSFTSKVKPEGGSLTQLSIALKLRYVSLTNDTQPETEANYLKLATDSINLHKQLPKEKSECPEMMLLAAMTLLRLALITHNSNYALQANHMLQKCHNVFDEYYPTAIRLIQLHLSQGLISLAMEKFASLAVKNIQWQTVGHLLLTRMSTLHPWPSGSVSDSVNPLVALDAGLHMLETAEQTLDKAIHDGLKYGSYSNIIDSIDVKDNMTRSMNRQVYIVEERRIQRLIGMSHDLALDPYPASMVDQRDFSFLPNFGEFEGHGQLETSLSCGPLPTKPWLIAMALHDHLFTYLKAEQASQLTLVTTSLDRLKNILDKTKQQDTDWASQLTEDEATNLACHQNLTEALFLSKDSPTTKQQEFDEHINTLKSWLDTVTSFTASKDTPVINSIETPTWKFLHSSYTILETLQTISHFLNLQTKSTKTAKPGKSILISKETLADLHKSLTDAEKAIHDRAQKLKDGIIASGVLGKLVDAATGRIEEDEFAKSKEYKGLAAEFAEFVDDVAVEEYCMKVRESWEDALNGVLRVKIRVTK